MMHEQSTARRTTKQTFFLFAGSWDNQCDKHCVKADSHGRLKFCRKQSRDRSAEKSSKNPSNKWKCDQTAEKAGSNLSRFHGSHDKGFVRNAETENQTFPYRNVRLDFCESDSDIREYRRLMTNVVSAISR